MTNDKVPVVAWLDVNPDNGEIIWSENCLHDYPNDDTIALVTQPAHLASMAEKDAEIAGWRADQKENIALQVELHQQAKAAQADSERLRAAIKAELAEYDFPEKDAPILWAALNPDKGASTADGRVVLDD